MPIPSTAYIALGSNMGDRRAQLLLALTKLGRTPEVRVVRASDFLENPAVGGPPGSPPFLNAAAELATTLPPEVLLAEMLAVERAMGRDRRVKWEPRTIDLDLLLFGDRVLATPDLTLPHPLMHRRLFVLTPLEEIAPDVLHPVLGRRITDLAEALRREELEAKQQSN